MKFCPYCGADIINNEVSFCSECGKSLFDDAPAEKKMKKRPKKEKRKRNKSKDTAADDIMNPEEAEANDDSDYDGYYDDVLPADIDVERQTIDKGLIKQLVILIAGVILIITICIIVMSML